VRIRSVALVVALAIMPLVAIGQNYDAGLSGDAGLEAVGRGDYGGAMREWRQQAERGSASAQYNLGLMYSWGQGVPRDLAEAARWFRLSADQGHVASQLSLGLIFDNGLGAPRDDAEAVRWYRRAAEQGNANGQLLLGLMLYDGRGAPQDFVTAHMWMNIAAANGDTAASERRDMAAGRMMPADISEAQRRARVCMASGYEDCN